VRQCRVTLVTPVQEPWPSKLWSKISDDVRIKATATQEVSLLVLLSDDQIAEMQSDQWVSEMCAELWARHAISCKDIRTEIVK